MYSLFTDPGRLWGGQIVQSRFKDVEKHIVEDVQRVVDYYRASSYSVPNQHLLARFVVDMNVPLSYELDQYYETATARSLFVANSFRFTSSIAAGAWHRGQFYYQCPELVIAYNTVEDPNELIKDWKNLQAVVPLEHSVSNLCYMLPNGRRHNIEQGLAVIGINIATLMVQYRGFCLEQQAKALRGESVLGAPQFIAQYVLPNMLYRQTDLALHNRLFNLQTGAPMGDSLARHPFRITDPTLLLDKGLMEITARFQTTKLPYRNLLAQIPKVFSDYPLQMPDIAETRQVWWALFLTRLKAMEWLMEVGGEVDRHYNQTELNALKIDLKRFISDNVFSKGLPDGVDDIPYRLHHLLQLC